MVSLQQLPVDARLGVEALSESLRHHFDQVAVARLIFAKQHQVVRTVVDLKHLIKAGARRDVDLAADHRLDPLPFALLIEVDHAVHHAVIGDCAGGLPQFFYPLHQLWNAAGAVEQAVFGMYVKMHKLFQ